MKYEWVKKVLLIGSGGIRIGQAAEFDYSGSQALKALREEGIKTVLVNPNIATIQTSLEMADKVYLEPITKYFLEKIIERERPDAILLGFGGQTALNAGLELENSGVLKKFGVKPIGISVDAIEKTGNRKNFRDAMLEFGIPVPESDAAYSVEEGLRIAERIGYPVIARLAYTLGGGGSGVARNEQELEKILSSSFVQSLIHQVLIEKYLENWKELEYEVVRDYYDNSIIVCNMENLDPMGIHTGESIVVAPSQTLTNREYHFLREVAIKAVRNLGIVGECNIQFALDPESEKFYAIEINSRLSRSSALASKATGYPLAYIAAKLAIGYSLPELTNKVTGVTSCDFEPSLDYIVTKIPKWDFQKFEGVDRNLGSQMKSVGEVMAIGRCFEESLQKAIRCLGFDLLNDKKSNVTDVEEIKDNLKHPTDERIFYTVSALRRGITVEEISKLSGIGAWFLEKIQHILGIEKKLCQNALDRDLLREAKRFGFSDGQIAKCQNASEDEIRKIRISFGIKPCVKQIDTLAAEWPAKTNYLYLTYGGDENDLQITETGKDLQVGNIDKDANIPPSYEICESKRTEGVLQSDARQSALVIGSGPIRIGSSVEFDWCTVNCVWGLKERGIQAAVLNCNPETVSTDYDASDRLYFDEITLERVLDIADFEKNLGNFKGVVVSVGGQTPNNLAKRLSERGVKILGTSAESIDKSEDREKFSNLLDSIQVKQPVWKKLTSLSDAEKFSNGIGYPVMIRPSYVLSGAAMRIAKNQDDLEKYIMTAADVSKEHPVVISKFVSGAKEVEVDAASDGDSVFIGAVIEHVEEAGVHSGDATMVIPPQTLREGTIKEITDITTRIAKSLEIRGQFNIQYLVKENTGSEIQVIECNLRASRSMPYTSKSSGINLIKLATGCMLGEKINPEELEKKRVKSVCVKSPMFSFIRLQGSDPILGVEMMSTGEVACFGENFEEAFLKALLATEINLKVPGKIFISLADDFKSVLPDIAGKMQTLGCEIFTTSGNAEYLSNHGIKDFRVLKKVHEGSPNVMEYVRKGGIDMIVNAPGASAESIGDERLIRQAAVGMQIPVFTRMETAATLMDSLVRQSAKEFSAKSMEEYYG